MSIETNHPQSSAVDSPLPKSSANDSAGRGAPLHKLTSITIFFREVAALMRREPLWVAFAAAYLCAWIVPFAWCWPRWRGSNFPLAFQPLMLLLFVALIWSDRPLLQPIQARLARRYSSRSRQRRGNYIPFALGCLAYLFGCCVQVKGVIVGALLLTVAGAIYWSFGPVITQALAKPFAFLLLIVPPPDSLVERSARSFLTLTVRIAGTTLHLLHHSVIAVPVPLTDGFAFQGLGEPLSLYLYWDDGLGNVLCTLVFLAGYGAMIRIRPTLGFGLAILGAALAFCLNLLRVIGALLINPQSHSGADLLLHGNGFLLDGVAAIVSFLLIRRINGISLKAPQTVLNVATDLERGIDRATAPVADGIAYVGRVAWQRWHLSERGIEALLQRIFSGKKRS